ncbi:MAG: hypothetical protein R3C14_43255 [Caldilineaceae bacterium]
MTVTNGTIPTATNMYTKNTYATKPEEQVLHSLHTPIERMAQADPADIQQIAAAQIELLSNYYKETLRQADASFQWALVAAGAGFAFFVAAIGLALDQELANSALISATGGALTAFISAINFYLYSRAAWQMTEYQGRLDKTQRFLLANSICEGLANDAKQQTRAQIIQKMIDLTYSADSFKIQTNVALPSDQPTA